MWEILGSLASGIGNYFAAKEQSKAAEAAAQAQLEAANRAMEFQNQQFNKSLGFQKDVYNQGLGYQQQQFDQARGMSQEQMAQLQSLFGPYTQAGQQALGGMQQLAQAGMGGLQGQQALIGLLGPQAQEQAISGLSSSPEMQALVSQGENAILQNASATGGLRGGNTQAALAQFRPQMLSNLINQQYQRLGGIAGLTSNYGALGQLGQGSAAGQASGGLDALRSILGLQGSLAGNVAGMSGQLGSNVAGLTNNYANQVTDLYGQQGAIGAGNALAQGKANAGMWNALGGIPNQYNLMSRLTGNQQWGGLNTANTGSYGPGEAQSLQNALAQLNVGYPGLSELRQALSGFGVGVGLGNPVGAGLGGYSNLGFGAGLGGK